MPHRKLCTALFWAYYSVCLCFFSKLLMQYFIQNRCDDRNYRVKFDLYGTMILCRYDHIIADQEDSQSFQKMQLDRPDLYHTTSQVI